MEQAKHYKHSVPWVFSPVSSPPTEQGDKTVTASSALLFSNALATAGRGVRRIRIVNTDTAVTIGIFLLRAAATVTSLDIANSVKIGPGMIFETTIQDSMCVAAISASGSVTVNVFVHDIF